MTLGARRPDVCRARRRHRASAAWSPARWCNGTVARPAGWLLFGVLAALLTALVWPVFAQGDRRRTGARCAERRGAGAGARGEMALLTGLWALRLRLHHHRNFPAGDRAPGPARVLWLDMFWSIFGVGRGAGALLSTRVRIAGDLRLLLAGCYAWRRRRRGQPVSPTLAGFALGSLLLGLPFTTITFFAMQEARRLRGRQRPQLHRPADGDVRHRPDRRTAAGRGPARPQRHAGAGLHSGACDRGGDAARWGLALPGAGPPLSARAQACRWRPSASGLIRKLVKPSGPMAPRRAPLPWNLSFCFGHPAAQLIRAGAAGQSTSTKGNAMDMRSDGDAGALRGQGLGRRLLRIAAMLVVPAGVWLASSFATERAVGLPPPAFDPPSTSQTASAVLAGGCFWGVQAVFQHTQGVLSAVSGYSGGPADRANYEAVGTGGTGHAESVQVTYDPRRISYGKLLQIFFSVVHDPTELNRQGPDSGPQYRSVIFFADPNATAGRPALHRAIERNRPRISGEDRDAGRAAHRLLSRRGLPPGLCNAASGLALHRGIRPAEDCQHEVGVSWPVP